MLFQAAEKTAANLAPVEEEDSREDSIDSLDQVPLSQPCNSREDAESQATSASEFLFAELSEKTKLLQIAQVRADEYKRRCDALTSKLSSSKKRQRDELSSAMAPGKPSDDENPKKKSSPEAAGLPPSVTPREPLPVGAFTQDSDDDVPLPRDGASKAPPKKANNRLFEALHSVLCGYKDKQIVPGSKDLPFEVCAEMCKEEAAEVLKWTPSEKKLRHQNVLSAIKLVYPNKKDEWFSSKFLLHPQGAAQYWSRVLSRRAEIWYAAGKRAAVHASMVQPKSLKQKIREKIAQRRASRIKAILPPPIASPSGDPFKTPTRRKKSALSSSDSDPDEKQVIDLSTSPSASASSSSKSAPSPAPQARLAPGPS